MKSAILLVNLGTPDAPTRSAVYRYLKQFLLDPRVIDYPWLPRHLLVRALIVPFRSGSSAKLYRELWTDEGSPLKIYGENLVREMNKLLPKNWDIRLAMRYQNPGIPEVLESMRKDNIQRIVVLPLFPQYASATTGSVHDEVMRVISGWQSIPDMHFISSYADNPGMIELFSRRIVESGLEEADHLLFSFHGVPKRQLKRATLPGFCENQPECCRKMSAGNAMCYSAQCHLTARSIAGKLGLGEGDYSICYQSRLGPEEWTRPYTQQLMLDRLEKGDKKLLVCAPSFTADCLETTIEIGREYAEEFEEAGGEWIRLVPSLNDDPEWAKTLIDLVFSPYGRS